MNICFLSSMHPADDKRVHYKEAVSLVRNGYSVTHICPDPKGNRDLDGVNIVTFSGSRSIIGRLSLMRRLYKLALKENADVYHCNEVDSWITGVALKIFHKKYIIFDSHEIPSHDFAETRFPKFIRPTIIFIMQILFRVFLRFTDQLVLAKSSADMDFRKTKVPKHLVRNYTDASVIKKNTTNDNIKTLKKDTIDVIHLGAINKTRGWPQMLDAIAQTKNKNIRLRVIGQFGDNTDNEFLARVEELKISDRVTFEKWIPYDEVYAALRSCDIGIILFQPGTFSFVHALPHKLFDYMLAELPVIVPDFALEVSEIVRNSDCGITLDPSNIQDVADALDKLADDAKLRKELGQKGREAIHNTYNWANEEKTLVDLYDGIRKAM